jgi:drug/metabolite transporter (DMT)-like permease
MKPKTLSLIQVNSAVFLWGLTIMFPRAIAMSPEVIVCFRSIITVIVLGIFLKSTGGRLDLEHRRDYGLMGILGVILCVHWVTLFAALQMGETAVVVVALNTYPALTTLAEPFAFGKRPKRVDVLLAFVVFFGVLLLLPGSEHNVQVLGFTIDLPSFNFTSKQSIAIGLAVLSGALFATRNIIIRKYASHHGGSKLMFWQALVTAVLLVAFIPRTAEPYTPKAVGMLLLLGVVFTALPQSLYAASMKHLRASTVGILSLMQVFYGGVWGYLIYRDVIDLRTAIGGAIILACVAFETLRNTQSKSPELHIASHE